MTQHPVRLTPRRLAAAQGGASTAEFAIVLPMFLLLLFAVLEFARLFWSANAMQYAVAQGARYAMTSPGGNGRPTPGTCATWSPATYQTSVGTYLTAQLAGYFSSSAVAATPIINKNCTANPPTVTVTVSATYSFSFIVSSLVPLGPINLTQTATVTAPLL